MKTKAILPLILILFFLFLIFACSVSTYSKDPLDTERFEYVLYDGLNSNITVEISENLESNYQRIINDLKVQNMPKVTVKIWGDYNNFLNAMETDIGTRYTGATGYIFGMTEFRIYYNAQTAMGAVHEFAHLVSMQVNSSILNKPRWLWEAVALYENNEFVDPKSLPYMVSGNYPTLDELNTDYNSGNQYIYSVGYVLLEYVVRTWGMDTVIELIKNNGDISGFLGITTQEFESDWYQFVEGKYLIN
jgi:hypothetical protein